MESGQARVHSGVRPLAPLARPSRSPITPAWLQSPEHLRRPGDFRSYCHAPARLWTPEPSTDSLDLTTGPPAAPVCSRPALFRPLRSARPFGRPYGGASFRSAGPAAIRTAPRMYNLVAGRFMEFYGIPQNSGASCSVVYKRSSRRSNCVGCIECGIRTRESTKGCLSISQVH